MKKFERIVGMITVVLIAVVAVALTQVLAEVQGGNALYLVEFEATEAGAPTTRDQAIELLEKLVIPSLESLSKEGKILSGGLFVGARAGAFVVSAKSHDEVTELVRALPAWGVWGWKVTPLESFSHRAALEKKMVNELRAQK